MEKDFDVFEEVRKGNLIKVSRWLIDNVFSIASLSTPDEWIRAITGESLNTDYFLDYLEGKFTALYQLS
jgi:carboxypeptidase Taq